MAITSNNQTGSREAPLWHVVITRFSYRDPKRAGGGARKPSSDWVTKENPLSPERLEFRFPVFEITCASSLLAQTNQDFDWIIVVDKALPARYRMRLQECIKGRPRSHVHDFDPEEDLARSEWLEQYAPRSLRYLLTTVLDDDDALPEQFFAAIHSHIATRAGEDATLDMVTFGCKASYQWEMISSRKAPLGYRCWWHRGNWVRSTGFSLLCEHPRRPITVFALPHLLADLWFHNERGDALWAVVNQKWGGKFPPTAAQYVESEIEKFRLKADLSAFEGPTQATTQGTYVDVGASTGPVIIANHFFNDQVSRVLEHKADRAPVAGPESFGSARLRLDLFRDHAHVFRKGWRMYAKFVSQALHTKISLWMRVRLALWTTWRFLNI
jgi:hypothetical protein